jgi:peptidoglycan/LPS O-acetylase OafA/YrhL
MHTFGSRRDIDGLRALAVIPVVLFHFGISPFSGGFVGVDVFFVRSMLGASVS